MTWRPRHALPRAQRFIRYLRLSRIPRQGRSQTRKRGQKLSSMLQGRSGASSSHNLLDSAVLSDDSMIREAFRACNRPAGVESMAHAGPKAVHRSYDCSPSSRRSRKRDNGGGCPFSFARNRIFDLSSFWIDYCFLVSLERNSYF